MKHLTAVVSIAFLSACQPRHQSDPHASSVFRRANPHEVAATEYRVAPPDRLLVRAPGVKELDNLTPTIRPDGRIAAALVGEVEVTNKTPDELSRLLTALVSRFYSNVEVRVEVQEYHSKFYSVTGVPLRNGGRKPFTGRDTVVSALVDAGFTQDAWPEQVHLSRPESADTPRTRVIVDFKHMSETGDLSQNYLLKEGDILHVKNGPLAQFRIDTQNVLAPGNHAVGTVQSVAPAGR